MKTVVGLFESHHEAEMVAREMESIGIRRDDISIISNNAHGSGSAVGGATAAHQNTGSVGGNAVKGAAEGAAIGGATGLLAAAAATALVPGVGPVLAIGPLAAALTGAAWGAAGGGLIGALSGTGVPKEHAELYAEGVRRGGTLVTVHADDAKADRALEVFNRHNPIDIEERGNYYRSTGYTGYSDKLPAYTPDQIAAERESYNRYHTTAGTMPGRAAMGTGMGTSGTTHVRAGEEVSIPIVEEQMEVGKRQVQSGGARIHTYVSERPVEESVTLREEHVNVERHPVNRAVTAGDMEAFREGTIEVTERSEVPVVEKEARVVEEVVVNKQATERTETIRDTVRRTDVDVEELDREEVIDGSPRVGVGRGVGNNVPGVQTGGRNADGSPDTRGVTEKVADAVTGDRTDDKTGKRV